MDEPHIKIVKMPMHDTGLGREAGFENDQQLIEHAERERAKLDPEVRALVDQVDAEFQRRVLGL
jgi:hypothetical protein